MSFLFTVMASYTDMLLWRFACLQLGYVHVQHCVPGHKSVFLLAASATPCIIRWSCESLWDRAVCVSLTQVCVHFVTDVGSCMFASRIGLTNITAFHQTACSPALLRSGCCLCDATWRQGGVICNIFPQRSYIIQVTASMCLWKHKSLWHKSAYSQNNTEMLEEIEKLVFTCCGDQT